MRKGKVLNMQESIVNRVTPPAHRPAGRSSRAWPWPRYSRWGPARRPAGDTSMTPCRAASCRAGDHRRRLHGEANFGFNFTCEMTAKNKAVIKGQITYHDTAAPVCPERGVDVPGDQAPRHRENVLIDPMTSNIATRTCDVTCQQVVQLAGPSSRAPTGPRTRRLTSDAPAEFTVLVFDQGEPGAPRDPDSSPGTGSPSSSPVGPYTAYTRAGYIEGGNIQVEALDLVNRAVPAAWRATVMPPAAHGPTGVAAAHDLVCAQLRWPFRNP